MALKLNITMHMVEHAILKTASQKYVDDSTFWNRAGTVLSPKTAGDDIEVNGVTILDAAPILVFRDSNGAGANSTGFIEWRDQGGGRAGYFGNASSGDDDLSWSNEQGGHIKIITTGAGELQVSAPLNMNTHKIVGVVDPTANQEAATKKYVDDNDTDTTAHASFSQLDYASAAHTGFEPAKGADDNFVTDAEKIVIGNTSNTNTGDQAITPEGTAVLSTGEGGATKFLREDGDGTCSWQVAGGAASPIGSIIMFGAVAAPSGWLLCNGVEVSQATYAALYAVLGADAFGTDAGGNFFLPNMTQKFPRGIGTIGATGGSDDAINVSHGHADTFAFTGNAMSNHGHADNFTTANQSASHTHTTDIGWHGHDFKWRTTATTGVGYQDTAGEGSTINRTSNLPVQLRNIGNKGSGNQSASHSHTVNGAVTAASAGTPAGSITGAVTNSGASGTDANLPAYLEVNFIIKT